MAEQQGWKLTGFYLLILTFNKHPQRFGERLRLRATGEVVLSAGSVSTPQILLLSGIGDSHHLKEVGPLLPALS